MAPSGLTSLGLSHALTHRQPIRMILRSKPISTLQDGANWVEPKSISQTLLWSRP